VTEPRLFRVILPVSNIEVAASFYAEILGMPGDRVSPGRHYFPCGGTILACYDALSDGDPAPVGPNPQYFYFSVDDLEAIHERVRRRSERDVTPIESRPWGERSFYANDPFGNPICFVDSKTLFTPQQRLARPITEGCVGRLEHSRSRAPWRHRGSAR
jgi:catechol 2,3-dioxygenase-like lactoylglutathione lyase family enzyme